MFQGDGSTRASACFVAGKSLLPPGSNLGSSSSRCELGAQCSALVFHCVRVSYRNCWCLGLRSLWYCPVLCGGSCIPDLHPRAASSSRPVVTIKTFFRHCHLAGGWGGVGVQNGLLLRVTGLCPKGQLSVGGTGSHSESAGGASRPHQTRQVRTWP